MKNKFTSVLFLFDLIGPIPQLFIFNNKRYKSLLSSIISIIIIIISLYFAIVSLVDYLKFDDPVVSYTKANDEDTVRNYPLNDLILLFQLVDSSDDAYFNTINESIAFFIGVYGIQYNNGTSINYPINIENCEFGKNINNKYKDMKFADNKNTYGRHLNEFYCINYFNNNLSLFYYPNYGFSFISLSIILKNNSLYHPEDIQSLIISENDIINHSDKKEPIKKNYIFQFGESFSSSEFTTVFYNFQYINYESDEGYFSKNSRNLNGITYSDFTNNKNRNKDYNLVENLQKNNYAIIGRINFIIEKSNFDNYKRTYKRLQALLAEIMSVFSLLFEVGNQISNILNQKKMCKDIFELILNNNVNNNSLNYNKNLNININKYILNLSKKETSSERSKKDSNTPHLIKNIEINDLNKLDENNVNNNNQENKINSYNLNNANKELLKHLSYFHYIKSYLCFKDEKSELINNLYSFIQQELCIEAILSKIYRLENFYYINTKENLIKYNMIKKNKRKNTSDKRYINNNNKNKDNSSIKEIKISDLISK